MQRQAWLSPPPFQQARTRDRHADVAVESQLRALEQSIRRRDGAATHQPARDPEGRGRCLFALLESGRIAQRAPSVGARSAPETMPAQSEPVGRIHVRIRAAQSPQQKRVQVHEADHVEAVVLEHELQHLAWPVVHVLEVRVRRERSGDRVLALVTEEPLLDRAKGAALHSMAVKRAHERQQVDVRRMLQVSVHSRHHPSRAEDRQVERRAVEAAHARRLRELVAQRLEESGFHARLGQKQLRETESAIDRSRHSSRENVSARSAGKASGLGVDIGDRAWVRIQTRQSEHVLAQEGWTEWRLDPLETSRNLERGPRIRLREAA